VLDAFRDDWPLSWTPFPFFPVVLTIVLEPIDVAVAPEGMDVNDEAVEEHTVVADHDGAAGHILQRRFGACRRFGVEILGGFVEQQ
jgi:hypothetical protein